MSQCLRREDDTLIHRKEREARARTREGDVPRSTAFGFGYSSLIAALTIARIDGGMLAAETP